MQLKQRNILIYLVGASLIASSLACNLLVSRTQPTPTPTLVPAATEAVKELEQQVQSAATQIAESGKVSLEVTETQLTSVVSTELQKQETKILTDPQVLLRDGQVQLTGKVNQNGLNLPIKIAVAVSANDQGRLAYQVVSATLGPISLPQSMLDQLTEQIDNALAGEMGAQVEDVFIEKITIADGVMTITGHKR